MLTVMAYLETTSGFFEFNWRQQVVAAVMNELQACAHIETTGRQHHSGPVSYTHLDVYKRQVLGSSVSYAQTLTAGQAQKSAQADAFLDYEKALITGGLDAATPVSYTHLDVYKRQQHRP